uniref:Cytochrome b6-f complex subunit VI n=1 Tax=Galdieria sulphuraria TaxID=130081 RepID=A0A075W1R9_GALSU|nr:cytochrome b6-f complex subunit VI [Galdieria sulphuraria]AIG92642.1 cytochrome b6-f complex subunit VI [Galdieria sulphuraria]
MLTIYYIILLAIMLTTAQILFFVLRKFKLI